MGDSLELQLVRAWRRYAEHLAGQHNQKSHAGAKSTVKLTSIEKEAVKTYTGAAYSEVNNYLRHGEETSEQNKDLIKPLDDAIKKSIVSERTKVFRGAEWYDIDAVNDGDLSDIRQNVFSVGSEFKDDGFISTSKIPEGADSKTGTVAPVLFEIDIQPGSNALDAEMLSHYQREKEMILPRGTKFKVTKIEKEGDDITDLWKIKMEVIQ